MVDDTTHKNPISIVAVDQSDEMRIAAICGNWGKISYIQEKGVLSLLLSRDVSEVLQMYSNSSKSNNEVW